MADITDKLVGQGLLYDFYGQLLTPHQQEVYELFAYSNLSYGEIADEMGVSKQAVSDLLHRATRQLEAYEEKLGMLRRFSGMEDLARDLEEGRVKDISPETGKETATRIRRILKG